MTARVRRIPSLALLASLPCLLVLWSGTALGDDGGAGDGGAGDGAACPANVDAGTLPLWRIPRPGSAGSCIEADLQQVHEHLGPPPDAGEAGTSTAVGDAGVGFYLTLRYPCNTCVVSYSNDPYWQPVIATNLVGASRMGFINPGACYAVADGGSIACGKAVTEEALCVRAACDTAGCSPDPACPASAASTTCAAEHATVADSCGAAKASLDSECADLEAQIRIVCGGQRPPLSDAGPFSNPPPSDVEAGVNDEGWAGDGTGNSRGCLSIAGGTEVGTGSLAAGSAVMLGLIFRCRRRKR